MNLSWMDKMRKLTTDKGVFGWRAGESGVVIQKPNGKKVFVGLMDLGINPNDFEKGQYKRTTDGMITPSIVANWINNNENTSH